MNVQTCINTSYIYKSMYCRFYTEVLLLWMCATSRKQSPRGWGLSDRVPQSYLPLLSSPLHVFGFGIHGLQSSLLCFFAFCVFLHINFSTSCFFIFPEQSPRLTFGAIFVFYIFFLNCLFRTKVFVLSVVFCTFTTVHLIMSGPISQVCILNNFQWFCWAEISAFFLFIFLKLFLSCFYCHFEGWQSSTFFFNLFTATTVCVSPWIVKYHFVSVKNEGLLKWLRFSFLFEGIVKHLVWYSRTYFSWISFPA